jgi:peptidyl-prolyl cis-trans isomerase D
MISWIQRTFQHHFRLIFAILLVGMVIPFIFTIGSTPGIGRADRRTATRDFFGHNLLSQTEARALIEDARISADLQYGQSVTPDQIQYYMYQRVAAQYLADQLHVPQPSTTEITEFIKRLRIFAGPQGQFDVTRYDAFRNSLKGASGTSEADIARVIRDDVRMVKLQRFLAGPGYVTPGDVKEILLKGDTSWTLSLATVDYAAFSPDINLTEAEISKFYSDNIFRYTVAPRTVADCVRFSASDFTAGIAPTDAEVREYYDSNPSLFPKPQAAKPAAGKADPNADFAAVQAQVRQALILETARQGAVKAASDLAYALYEGKVSRDSLASFLASRKLKTESLAPFTREAGPAELGGSPEVANAAFELNAARFYSEGLPTKTGAVVLIWKELLPSREPALAEVREKVVADAKDNQKRIRFVEFGRSLRAGIERRLKSGDSFDKAVAAAAGGVKVEVKNLPAFTLRSQPRDVDPSVFSLLDRLQKGGVSEMEATAEKGILVYAADKKTPVTDESNPLFAQYKLQLADSYARADATSIMRELVDGELKRSEANAK